MAYISYEERRGSTGRNFAEVKYVNGFVVLVRYWWRRGTFGRWYELRPERLEVEARGVL